MLSSIAGVVLYLFLSMHFQSGIFFWKDRFQSLYEQYVPWPVRDRVGVCVCVCVLHLDAGCLVSRWHQQIVCNTMLSYDI